ncbi:hypothetical protein BBW65_05740 [Helicobacter enhydrae]|uniref:Alpha/beta hydrolase n=1 Tax=Helicobacter enhydrae TaxID=222136 RepID=A0A1B1U6H5_9HELI|nr:hypothetical protein BBW65_05740 [Helicobacter enhydrae]
MIQKELLKLKKGEPLSLVAHSHGGNVVKYASKELKQIIDDVVFLATPHREDVKFNYRAMKE